MLGNISVLCLPAEADLISSAHFTAQRPQSWYSAHITYKCYRKLFISLLSFQSKQELCYMYRTINTSYEMHPKLSIYLKKTIYKYFNIVFSLKIKFEIAFYIYDTHSIKLLFLPKFYNPNSFVLEVISILNYLI